MLSVSFQWTGWRVIRSVGAWDEIAEEVGCSEGSGGVYFWGNWFCEFIPLCIVMFVSGCECRRRLLVNFNCQITWRAILCVPSFYRIENRFLLGSGTLCTRVSTISRIHKKGSKYSHETNAPECSSSVVHSPRRKETVVIPVSRIRERRRARSAFTRRALRVISLVRAGVCRSVPE